MLFGYIYNHFRPGHLGIDNSKEVTHPIMNISIAKEVFEKFPTYRRGLIIAHGIQNGPSPDELIAHIREAETALCASLDSEKFVEHPKIAAWREAYRSVGIKPGDYRPSVDALIRRVLKKDPLPAINRIVDIGNLVSIQNLCSTI